MLILEQGRWWRQVSRIRGSALTAIWRRVLITGAVAGVVTWVHETHDIHLVNLTPLPFSLIGVALGIFLGFRNNTSYDRFWEGRKLWGRLVNVSRSFARQVYTMVGTEDTPADELRGFRRELVERHIAFVHALRVHLRTEAVEPADDVVRVLGSEAWTEVRGESNPPNAILHGTGERIGAAHRRAWIDAMHVPALDASLTEMATVQGACERIRNTPIPASYTVLIHRIVLLYCLGLPFGIVAKVGLLTPLVVLIVAYAFYGLDAVGNEIENPFGVDANDLPLRALSTMIEANLRDRLGEQGSIELARPVDGVLL